MDTAKYIPSKICFKFNVKSIILQYNYVVYYNPQKKIKPKVLQSITQSFSERTLQSGPDFIGCFT